MSTNIEALVEKKKSSWVYVLQFLLPLVVAGLVVYAILSGGDSIKQTMESNSTFKYIVYASYALAAFSVLSALVHLITKKTVFCVLCMVFELIASLAACYVGFAKEFGGYVDVSAACVAAALSLFPLLFTFFVKRIDTGEEVVVDPYAGFVVEQYIETYAYQGGPVDGIEVATEVNPTEAAANGTKPDLATLVGNGFDPFMYILNEEEKAEFIDLYIMRCKCEMPEIPGYVVGGDNKDFFNKVFIYLGQYREKISNTLLQKMYDFAMKL